MSDSFKIKRSVKDCCGQLSDAECGRLFRAMLSYAFDGKTEELRGNEQYAWSFVREMIEDTVTDRRSLTSKANGKKGGRPIEPTQQQNLFELGFVEKSKERRKEDAPSPTEKKERTKERKEYTSPSEEKKKEPPIYIAPAHEDSSFDSAQFDSFWAAYPRRVGKGAARKAFAKAITKVDLQTMLDALEKRKHSPQWTRDGGNFIPHPSTWLNQERWEDDLDTEGGDTHGESISGLGGCNQGNGGKQFNIVYDV